MQCRHDRRNRATECALLFALCVCCLSNCSDAAPLSLEGTHIHVHDRTIDAAGASVSVTEDVGDPSTILFERVNILGAVSFTVPKTQVVKSIRLVDCYFEQSIVFVGDGKRDALPARMELFEVANATGAFTDYYSRPHADRIVLRDSNLTWSASSAQLIPAPNSSLLVTGTTIQKKLLISAYPGVRINVTNNTLLQSTLQFAGSLADATVLIDRNNFRVTEVGSRSFVDFISFGSFLPSNATRIVVARNTLRWDFDHSESDATCVSMEHADFPLGARVVLTDNTLLHTAAAATATFLKFGSNVRVPHHRRNNDSNRGGSSDDVFQTGGNHLSTVDGTGLVLLATIQWTDMPLTAALSMLLPLATDTRDGAALISGVEVDGNVTIDGLHMRAIVMLSISCVASNIALTVRNTVAGLIDMSSRCFERVHVHDSTVARLEITHVGSCAGISVERCTFTRNDTGVVRNAYVSSNEGYASFRGDFDSTALSVRHNTFLHPYRAPPSAVRLGPSSKLLNGSRIDISDNVFRSNVTDPLNLVMSLPTKTRHFVVMEIPASNSTIHIRDNTVGPLAVDDSEPTFMVLSSASRQNHWNFTGNTVALQSAQEWIKHKPAVFLRARNTGPDVLVTGLSNLRVGFMDIHIEVDPDALVQSQPWLPTSLVLDGLHSSSTVSIQMYKCVAPNAFRVAFIDSTVADLRVSVPCVAHLLLQRFNGSLFLGTSMRTTKSNCTRLTVRDSTLTYIHVQYYPFRALSINITNSSLSSPRTGTSALNLVSVEPDPDSLIVIVLSNSNVSQSYAPLSLSVRGADDLLARLVVAFSGVRTTNVDALVRVLGCSEAGMIGMLQFRGITSRATEAPYVDSNGVGVVVPLLMTCAVSGLARVAVEKWDLAQSVRAEPIRVTQLDGSTVELWYGAGTAWSENMGGTLSPSPYIVPSSSAEAAVHRAACGASWNGAEIATISGVDGQTFSATANVPATACNDGTATCTADTACHPDLVDVAACTSSGGVVGRIDPSDGVCRCFCKDDGTSSVMPGFVYATPATACFSRGDYEPAPTEGIPTPPEPCGALPTRFVSAAPQPTATQTVTATVTMVAELPDSSKTTTAARATTVTVPVEPSDATRTKGAIPTNPPAPSPTLVPDAEETPAPSRPPTTTAAAVAPIRSLRSVTPTATFLAADAAADRSRSPRAPVGSAATVAVGTGLGDGASTAVVAAGTSSAIALSVASPVAASRASRAGATTRLARCIEEFDTDDAEEDEPKPPLIEMPFAPPLGWSKLRFISGSLAVAGVGQMVFAGLLLAKYVASGVLPPQGSPVTSVTRVAAPLWTAYFVPTICGYSFTVLVGRSSDAVLLDTGVAIVAAGISAASLAVMTRLCYLDVPQYLAPASKVGPHKTTVDRQQPMVGADLFVAPEAVAATTTAVPVPDATRSDGDAPRKTFLYAFGPLFDAARSLDSSAASRLYFAVEVGSAAIVAALSGSQPSAGLACWTVGFAVVAISIAVLVYLLIVKPYRTKIDSAFAIVLAAAQVVVAVAMVGAQRWPSLIGLAGWALVVLAFGFFAQAVVAAVWAYMLHRRRQEVTGSRADPSPTQQPLLLLPDGRPVREGGGGGGAATPFGESSGQPAAQSHQPPASSSAASGAGGGVAVANPLQTQRNRAS